MSVQGERQSASELSGVFSWRALIPPDQGPSLITSSNPKYLPKVYVQLPSHCGVGLHCIIFRAQTFGAEQDCAWDITVLQDLHGTVTKRETHCSWGLQWVAASLYPITLAQWAPLTLLVSGLPDTSRYWLFPPPGITLPTSKHTAFISPQLTEVSPTFLCKVHFRGGPQSL